MKMHMRRGFLVSLFSSLLFSGYAHATTWNEPWHREVVSAATSFGLYEVVKSAPDAITLKRLKHIAGTESGQLVQVTSFYALRLTSVSSGHGPEFGFSEGKKAYFFLKQDGNAWSIATPSTGYAALIRDGKVAATYRFSAHQAVVEPALYEDTQQCIFQVLHGKTPCDPRIASFITAELAKPAKGLSADTPAEVDTFFRQHVALETAGFTRHPLPDETIERFLSEPDMHVQISALRALAAGPRADKAARLMRFVEDDTATLTARIMAALLLKEIGAREMKQRLLDYAAHASEEETGLGIGLMDPRIGTDFPATLRQAVKAVGERL